MIIHTIDMEFTRRHIGDCWEDESFPVMRECIKAFGIHTSIWLSRSFMYPVFLAFLALQERKWARHILLVVTILYWTAMIGWIDRLNIARWPFPLPG